MDYLVTFFSLVFAHYFHWDDIFPWKLPHPVRILINYVIGTVGMLSPFAFWLYTNGEFAILRRLIGFVIAAGLAPVLAYINDSLQSLRKREREKGEREEMLTNATHERE